MTSKRCSTRDNSCSNFDVFGRGYHFNLPGNKDTLGTCFGAAITTLMIGILVIYGVMQMHRLVIFGETVVTSSKKDTFYAMLDLFPDEIEDLQSTKFDLAFGITAYDGDPEPIEDPRYGRTYARYDGWGNGKPRNINIETHQCSEEELGISGDPENSRFFEHHPNTLSDF